MEDKLWWEMTFGERWPLMEDDIWWKMTFAGRWPLMEDALWWKVTSMEDDLWQKIKILLQQNKGPQNTMLEFATEDQVLSTVLFEN